VSFVFLDYNTMGKYATSIYPKSGILASDALPLTLNIAILAVLYTFLGALMSYVFYYLFDEYDSFSQSENQWEKKGTLYQILDIIIEIVVIAVSSFWIVFFINETFPIIPVRRQFVQYIDTYSTGLFFMFTIFIFVESFGNKLEHIFSKHVAPIFDYIFPNYGSIVDFSLSYRKKHGYSTDTN
jgi:hypothetical protein